MVPVVIREKDLARAWTRCVASVVTNGNTIEDDGVVLLELCNVIVQAEDVNEATLEAAGASIERIRLMREKYESLEIVPPYRISYGRLFRDHYGIDQVAWVTSRLLKKPETKSATIGFHQPGADDLSCVSMADFKLRSGALHMSAVYRSQNVVASQPGNAIALRALQTEIAEAVGCLTGNLTLHLMSAHIYDEDIPLARTISRWASEVNS